MSRSPLRMLILTPGPRFDLAWEFGVRLEGFSRFAEGWLVTTGQPAETLAIGNFEVSAAFFWPENVWSVLCSRLRFVRNAWRAIRRGRREKRPVDLIVAYDPLLTGLVAAVFARLYGARFVCEVNGDYANDVNFLHIRSGVVRAVKKWLALKLLRLVLASADGIRVLHPEQLAGLDYVPRTRQIVVQIPEFVDTSVFRNLGEQKSVLMVGFPFYVKGVDIGIAAFKRVASRHPDWRLIVMGHYPERAELDRSMAGCAAITHQEPVIYREMPTHIGQCGILLQPSRTEAMGRVLVEAMAAEKPRIASRVGGIPTVVDHGRDGLLVDVDDVAGFAAALDELMASPERRQALGAAGAARSRDEFAVGRYFDRTERFYRSVVEQEADV